MSMSLEPSERPDATLSPNNSNELIKLIRKLRWMGMDEEAQRLQVELTRRSGAAADCVVARSAETD